LGGEISEASCSWESPCVASENRGLRSQWKSGGEESAETIFDRGAKRKERQGDDPPLAERWSNGYGMCRGLSGAGPRQHEKGGGEYSKFNDRGKKSSFRS